MDEVDEVVVVDEVEEVVEVDVEEAADTVKGSEMPGVPSMGVAMSRKVPDVVIETEEKVARPSLSVVAEPSESPDVVVRETRFPDCSIELPKRSVTWTVGAGDMVVPAVTSLGSTENSARSVSWVLGMMVNWLEVAGARSVASALTW